MIESTSDIPPLVTYPFNKDLLSSNLSESGKLRRIKDDLMKYALSRMTEGSKRSKKLKELSDKFEELYEWIEAHETKTERKAGTLFAWIYIYDGMPSETYRRTKDALSRAGPYYRKKSLNAAKLR